MHDVVVSSRVRLARNLADMPFLTLGATAASRGDILGRLKSGILASDIDSKLTFVDVAGATPLDRPAADGKTSYLLSACQRR